MAESTKNMTVGAGSASASVTATVTDQMPGIPCPTSPGYEYTGMRYVPVFADPPEWSSANSYEPLEIVTHEGNSYTSKTFVPVGVDISNAQYWVLTGNYNAQVEAYRQQVERYAAQTATLAAKKTKILLIGDSFTAGSLSNWSSYLDSSYTLLNYAKNGSSFINPGSGGANFLQQLQNAKADGVKGSELFKILIYGGVNDLATGNTVNDVSTAISGCASYIKQNFPEADYTIVLGNIGRSSLSAYDAAIPYFYALYQNAKALAIPVESAVEWLVPWNTTAYQADNLHPNTTGQRIIASYMGSILFGGYSLPDFLISSGTKIPITGESITGTINDIMIRFSNRVRGTLSLTLNPISSANVTQSVYSYSRLTETKIGTLYGKYLPLTCSNINFAGYVDLTSGNIYISAKESTTAITNLQVSF